jgi:hypothetical protein
MNDSKGAASDPALLANVMDELERAELIIMAMFVTMTDEQKALVHQQLRAAHIVGDVMTRHRERRVVIERVAAAKAALTCSPALAAQKHAPTAA